MAAPKIIIEKPPVYGAVKGATAFNETDPWTAKQKAAGTRRQKVAGGGIGSNRVNAPRDQLVNVITGNGTGLVEGSGNNSGGTAVGSGGIPGNVGAGTVNIPGGFSNSNRAGYTTSGTAGTYGHNSGSGGDWGFTPTGVRSSAYNANGTWGNAASGNPGWNSNRPSEFAGTGWEGMRSVTGGNNNSGGGGGGFWSGIADALGIGGWGGGGGGGSSGGGGSGWGGWGGWGGGSWGGGGGGGGYGQSPGSDPWR